MAVKKGGSGRALSDTGKRSKPEFWNDSKCDGDADKGLGLGRGAKAGTPKSQADIGRRRNKKS